LQEALPSGAAGGLHCSHEGLKGSVRVEFLGPIGLFKNFEQDFLIIDVDEKAPFIPFYEGDSLLNGQLPLGLAKKPLICAADFQNVCAGWIGLDSFHFCQCSHHNLPPSIEKVVCYFGKVNQ